MPAPVDTVESFYAHALAIEREAADRYREFATYFGERGEAVLAAICEMLARMEAEHFGQLARASEGLVLPGIDRAAYGWDVETPVESGPRRAFYRLSEPEHLLEVALEGEMRAHRFFAWIAQTTNDATVEALARGMAEEEERHVRWVTRAIALRRPLPT